MTSGAFLYCPACQLDVEPIAGACPWCDGPVRRRIKGPGPGHLRRVTEQKLRTFHRLHIERGVSLREIARALVRQGRYASENSAVTQLGYNLRRLALPVRSPGEAAAIANRACRHPDSPGTSDRAAHKRWLRKRAGGYRPCAGVKVHAPERGRPCRHNAAPGSDFCWQHDPERRADVIDLMARMRERLPLGALRRVA